VARESGEAAWWRQTWSLAAITAGGGAVTGLVAVSVAGEVGGWQVLGLSPGGFFGVILAPLAIAAAAFVFAGRQQALDRRFDVSED
jgi:hypothetical protein